MLIQKLHELEDKERNQKAQSKSAGYLKWARLSRHELSVVLDLSIALKILEDKNSHSQKS